jgi:hypothetical protein
MVPLSVIPVVASEPLDNKQTRQVRHIEVTQLNHSSTHGGCHYCHGMKDNMKT